MGELIVGTRASHLALTQTELVCEALRAAHPGLVIRVERITTTGDARADVPLSQLGRGIFVSEIEGALRAGRIHFAVHSAKDLPSLLADDLTIAAFARREDARDVLVSPHGTLARLPRGARVGTSSPRRACLLRAVRPDAQALDIRGNVDTRLRKLRAGEYDAIILAAAGLVRLGRESEITEWLAPEEMIPAVGQGALAVEARNGDHATIALLRVLDHAPTRTAVTAERAFLAELGAGCRAAAGAHARVVRGDVHLAAFIGAADGRHVRGRRGYGAEGAAEAGRSLARQLVMEGGAAFLARAESPLRGRRVAVTRPRAQAEALEALLRAHGAEPVSCPVIEVGPPADVAVLDDALRGLRHMDWMVFTSANAVRAVSGRLSAMAASLPARVRLAAVGDATATALRQLLRAPDFVPATATAEHLAAELPVSAGQRMLFPRSDIAGNALIAGLRDRGVAVHDVVAYRTMPSPDAGRLAQLVREDALDAVVFTSPSAIRFADGLVDAATATGTRAPVAVCIGPATAAAASAAGLPLVVEARTQAVGGILEALERQFEASPARAAGMPA